MEEKSLFAEITSYPLMNSKQRVKTAMDLGTPDKVPIMCQFSIGHMLLQLHVSPAEFWLDADIFKDGLLKLREIYDFDGILVSLHGHHPNWRDEVKARQLTDEGEEVLWKNGDKTICFFDDLPRYICGKESEKTDIAHVSDAALPQTLAYIPVSQGLHFKIDPDHVFDIFKKIITEAGEQSSIHGEITSPFDYFLDYFGHQEALMALIDDPEKSKQVLTHFTKLIRNLALEMCDTGIDAIKVSSPFAGAGFISPDFYSEFVLPFEREIVEAVRQRQVHIYLHTCGAIGDRLGLMLASGANGIECLDPPPLGNVELDEAKEITKGKCFIKGNVDSVNLLLFASNEEIMADAKRRLEIGKAGGGYIFSTACSIAPRVRREAVLLLREAVEKWG